LRQDKGALWENFMIAERLKFLLYAQKPVQSYFWRTTTQQEIDYVETHADQIAAFEFKWSSHKKTKLPKSFDEAYHPSFTVVNRENFREILK
jgi:predicted AAA+ superfamily ATPase